VRIRAWEKVHGLRMPADSAHPILEVIAGDTRGAAGARCGSDAAQTAKNQSADARPGVTESHGRVAGPQTLHAGS
jgi:hypothetical protein